MHSGLVFNIQRYSVQDGPGIRTTVFLKGCPLCCAWCHNPEGIQPGREVFVVETRCLACGDCREACPLPGAEGGDGPLPARNPGCTLCGACVEACASGARQMVGRVMTVAEVMTEVLKDRIFYEDSSGGVTFSGGEPLMQPHFLRALLEACCARGVHAALDTTGFGSLEHLLSAAELAGLVLYDLKVLDEHRHRELTGVSNRGILENLKALDQVHRNIWIRLPVVPGFNDDLDNLGRIAGFVAGLRHVTLVNLLPFHRTALHKFERLGRAHALDGVQTPSPALMERAVRTFEDAGLKTRAGG
jgi:pyruvate formate lyase activating enzyme